jgi:hypothetical protein
MTVVDINTKKVIATYTSCEGHVFYTTKEYWFKYVDEVTKWGKEMERKFYYGGHTT